MIIIIVDVIVIENFYCYYYYYYPVVIISVKTRESFVRTPEKRKHGTGGCRKNPRAS